MTNLVFEKDPAKRPAFSHEIWPGAGEVRLEWRDWYEIMRRLEQKLAQHLRTYPGPDTTDDIPPEGGTPVARRMAA